MSKPPDQDQATTTTEGSGTDVATRARQPKLAPKRAPWSSSLHTEEQVGPASQARTLLLVIGTLLTVVLLNYGAGRLLHRHTTNIGYYLITAKWELLEEQSAPVDWLVLGDSSGNQSVRPDVIRGERGESGLNLCTIGDMIAVNDAWMLERYLREVGKPKHVVLVHVYDMWHRSAAGLRHGLVAKIPLGWGFWERMDPPLEIPPNLRQRLLLSRYAPLYAENTTLGEWLKHPSKLFGKRFTIDETGYMRNDLVRPDIVAMDASGHRSFVRGRKVLFSQANRLALAAIAKVSKEYGVPVTLAMAPIVETLWNDPAFRSYHCEVAEGLRKLGQQGNLRVVLSEPMLFAASRMQSADHLLHDAAAQYTRALVGAVLEAESSAGQLPREDCSGSAGSE